MIIGCTIIYCISSIIVGFSTNFSELLFFRFLCGLAHGAIASIITVVAIAIAPKNKHGTSVTATLVSLFMATCTFVPIFTFVSNMDIGANLPALSQIPIVHQNWR
ncbi:MFS transporter [bacterium]|nr:MFS transporter [bacterium]